MHWSDLTVIWEGEISLDQWKEIGYREADLILSNIITLQCPSQGSSPSKNGFRWWCTRPVNHKGPHIAYALNQSPYHHVYCDMWENNA